MIIGNKNGFGNDSNTTLLLHFNNNTLDSSSSAKTITDHSTTDDSSVYKFGGHSRYFSGGVSQYVGAYLSLANNADLNFGSGDFTVDTWINFSSSSGYAGIFTHTSEQTGSTNSGYLLRWGGNILDFYYSLDGTFASLVAHHATFAFTPALGTWYHLALVRNGANLKCYVNGSQIGSTYNMGTDSIYASTRVFDIGSQHDNTGEESFFNGYMDEFRVSKGIARWTKNFTVPNREY